uniref:Pleckstrin homology, MyTH4 and FERM domain containing H3 n=1 Tax=Anolis carolinensis TaxID=28377 RepID=A0A803U0H0_ANOCA
MPFPGGLWWLLCCRQGFTLLRRDYGEAGREEEEAAAEESFELRSPVVGEVGAGPLLCGVCVCVRLGSPSFPFCLHPPGWLQREVRGGIKTPWLRPRKYWFVLTEESLDYYSGCEMSARRLGSLVLTSLCSVLWPDKQTYKETGYWAVTVFGRKHCYRLYTEHLNEAVHWVCALQKVIVSKAPVQTPTQILMCDIEENRNSPEILDQIYHNNPVLCYTGGPMYAPLLPFPYAAPGGQGYAGLRDEAVKLFHSLQQLEGVREPALLMQGVLQTCHDLPPLVDEIYCQLVKQTTEPPMPGAPSDLRYWQLLTCMSCTFLPSLPVLCYLQLHLQRTERRFPDSEMVLYGHFITEALCKTKGRECVPSLDEIARLMRRQEMVCTVAITSHTTVQEVARELMLRLGLACSPNSFVLYEESWQHGCPLPEDALVADVLARFEKGVKLISIKGHISLMVAFKGPLNPWTESMDREPTMFFMKWPVLFSFYPVWVPRCY